MEILLDNSAISLMNCQRRFQLRVVQGKDEPRGSAAAFGDTVHKILQYVDEGLDGDAVIERVHKECPAQDIPKALSLVTYFRIAKKLPDPIKTKDGKPFVEVKFKHKYSSVIIPNSHELLDIYLTGTVDRVHIDPVDDCLVIADYKTSGAATAGKIDEVMNGYTLAFQLPFYFYCIKNFGILPAQYNDYLESRRYRMEILLLLHNTNPPSFKRVIRPAFNDDFINREIPLIVNQRIQEAVNIASLTTPAPHTGMTVYKACDLCGFRPACLVMGTPREDEILSRYELRPYNPLTFR